MSATDGGLDASTERAIDRFLDDWMADEDLPGCSVAVFDEDGVQYATGLGARDLETTEPATPETLYNAGSVTKVVTAIAVLQVAERTDLALDDAVADHVPFLADVPGDAVTVAELLSHTSGIPNLSFEHRENIATREDFRRHLDGGAANRVTEDPPHLYCNATYRVLGELVAAVDGRDYAEYVDQEVLAPLGMARSTLEVDALFEREDAMTGYRREDGDRVPTEDPREWKYVPHTTPPAEIGLNSPVTELTRVVRCLLNDGRLDGTRILDTESVAAMATEHARTGASLDGDAYGYGYGLGVEPFLGERLVGHSGGGADSLAYVGGLTDRELGVAIAINTTGAAIGDHGRAVLAIAAGESPGEHVWRFALAEKLDAVAGTYEAYRGPTATVEVDGGHLSIALETAHGDDQFPAFPTSLSADDHSFYTVGASGVRQPVEFRVTDGGTTMLFSRHRFDET